MLIKVETVSLDHIHISDYAFSSKYSINRFDIYTRYLKPKDYIINSKVLKAKKQLVVSLRAPKHFKVGRHHLNLESRLISTVFRFTNVTVSNTPNTLYLVPILGKQLLHLIPRHPITKRSKITLSINTTFSIQV